MGDGKWVFAVEPHSVLCHEQGWFSKVKEFHDTLKLYLQGKKMTALLPGVQILEQNKNRGTEGRSLCHVINAGFRHTGQTLTSCPPPSHPPSMMPLNFKMMNLLRK